MTEKQQTILSIALGCIAGALALVVFILLQGCTPDREPCKPPEMECVDNVAMYCTSDGEWVEEDDCSEVYDFYGNTFEWTCCMVDGEARCLEVCDGNH